LPDYLQDLGDIEVNPVPIPPLLLAVVTPEEVDLDPIGKEVLDLQDVIMVATRAIHGQPSSVAFNGIGSGV